MDGGVERAEVEVAEWQVAQLRVGFPRVAFGDEHVYRKWTTAHDRERVPARGRADRHRRELAARDLAQPRIAEHRRRQQVAHPHFVVDPIILAGNDPRYVLIALPLVEEAPVEGVDHANSALALPLD